MIKKTCMISLARFKHSSIPAMKLLLQDIFCTAKTVHQYFFARQYISNIRICLYTDVLHFAQTAFFYDTYNNHSYRLSGRITGPESKSWGIKTTKNHLIYNTTRTRVKCADLDQYI